MAYDKVDTTGKKEHYKTGAWRDHKSGKGRYDLIPTRGLRRVARHFENGAVTYGENNWVRGIPMHSYIDSAIRHLMEYKEAVVAGTMTEDHLAAAAWNALCAMATEEMIAEGILPADLMDIGVVKEPAKAPPVGITLTDEFIGILDKPVIQAECPQLNLPSSDWTHMGPVIEEQK